MRRTDLLLLLLTASLSLSAQQTRFATKAARYPLVSGGCPVNFGAELEGRAVMRSAEDAKHAIDSPLLKLTFTHLKTPMIKAATVTVHGLSATGRYLQVAEQPSEDRTQTFDLAGPSDASDLVSTEVSVNKMALVRWVEVTELTYADGSSWHSSDLAQCHAVPSRFHLVDATAH